MEYYLDNAATTRPLKEVCDLVTKVMYEDYGNPSSLHIKGFEAEKYLRQASERISKILKCQENEIVFTSGGTESNNMALIGSALANKRSGKHIITTIFEHASIKKPLLYLEGLGFEITRLKVDSNGHISLEELEKTIREDTILVTTMFVNNEIGSILDIEGISKIIKKKNDERKNSKILFHVDAIQAFGKMKINPSKLGIDLMSVSGHKIHGPKGSGFLYVKTGSKIHAYIHGGGQQKDMRSGTENVPAIAGLGLACLKQYENIDEDLERIYDLKKYFKDRLTKIEGVSVNACKNVEETAPHIISVSIKSIRSEVMLHSLEDKKIYVSSGSACSSNHAAAETTLEAIGLDKDLLDNTIRFSLSRFTTKEEVDFAVDELEKLIPVLSKFVRR